MRTLTFASLAVTALAIIENEPILEAMNCGSCYYNSGGFLRCNNPTADDDKFPFAPNQTGISNEDLIQHGVSTATYLTISEMRQQVTDAGYSWDLMFCSSYLDGYKDGQVTPSEGSACVSAPTGQAIMNADALAKQRYLEFGTENGYPASWAVSKDDPLPEQLVRWGTGGEGDVPANWCGTYMKYLLCGVAFPQVTFSAAEIAANPRPTDTTGRIRPIELDSCSSIFSSCNRRQPWTDETETDYIHPSLRNTRATILEGADEVENAVENDFYCKMWARGYDLAVAGPGVYDGDVGTITFESSSYATYSLVLVIVGAALQVLF